MKYLVDGIFHVKIYTVNTFNINLVLPIRSKPIRVDVFKCGGFNRVYLVKLYQSCVNFSNLKCGDVSSVYQTIAACASGRIALALVIFTN